MGGLEVGCVCVCVNLRNLRNVLDWVLKKHDGELIEQIRAIQVIENKCFFS